MPKTPQPTRDRIVQAAVELFYSDGIRDVSLDAVAEKAGVTKRTLYYHFDSKDALVTAYLQSRDQPTLDQFAKWLNETPGDLPVRVEGMFRGLARAAANKKWKGCGCLRTVAELAATPGHPAVAAGAAHKKRFEAWLQSVIAENGIPDAADRARQILILLEGAVSVLQFHRDPAYAEAAGRVAASLLRTGGAQAD